MLAHRYVATPARSRSAQRTSVGVYTTNMTLWPSSRALLAATAFAFALFGVSIVGSASDDASVRANEGIIMSRSMSAKDRVEAVESLARYAPRAAVPILIAALNETSEPVQRAAARGLWTIAASEDADVAASARAAVPALRIALGDTSLSVAMNAANALERTGEPPAQLAEPRRKALRTPGPYAYERFLAARGLIAIEPAPTLVPFILDWLYDEHRRADSASSSGARDNIRVANAALAQLVRSGDRGTLAVLQRELSTPRPGTEDVLRAMALASPPPERFARTLVTAADAPQPKVVAAAYDLMATLDRPGDLGEWVPAAARALDDPRRQEPAALALRKVAGKTPLGMPELARLGESTAPEGVRTTALSALAQASDATRDREPAVLAAAKPEALRAFRSVLARERTGPVFDEAIRGLRYTERDFSVSAAMYMEALEKNPDLQAKAQLLDYVAQSHSAAGPLADRIRPYAESGDPEVRRAAIAALDSIKPSWREASVRSAAVQAGTLPKAAAPQPGAKGAELAKFYGAVSEGDRAAIARLINAGNVNLPLVMPNGTPGPMVPIAGVLQHCGLPQVATAKIVAAVTQLVALGADPELRSTNGATAMDHAKAACPPEVQQALIGR